MDFDVFFSISQTPVDGHMPDERTMFRNFFDQVQAADRLGYGVAWLAESHLSSEVQKGNRDPVIPHWEGEVGLNADMPQMAHRVFQYTERIEVGSAVMNILCNGGPVAHAERLSTFAALHGLDPEETRRIHVGFSAGRFDFMNRAYGVLPRTPAEEAAGPVWKGKVFHEATEILCRLLRGDVLNSDQVAEQTMTRDDFRADEHWEAVKKAAGGADVVPVEKQFIFEDLKIIPQEWRRGLVQLVAGSHGPSLQVAANRWLPVQVFNLSITSPEVIDETHKRMREHYHKDGGPWKRSYMPRTVMVFLNEEKGLSPEERSQAAQKEAKVALGAYWTALQGTLDPSKVEKAADNAVIGTAEEIQQQLVDRFHPDDRLMLWFDFFNHDSKRVIRNMQAFAEEVAPELQQVAA